MGLGAWIWEVDRGRPLGMSTDRPEARCREDLCLELELELEWCEELLLDEECDLLLLDFLLDFSDLSWGTSRMFSSRPVVGSTVDSSLGLCETW